MGIFIVLLGMMWRGKRVYVVVTVVSRYGRGCFDKYLPTATRVARRSTGI